MIYGYTSKSKNQNPDDKDLAGKNYWYKIKIKGERVKNKCFGSGFIDSQSGSGVLMTKN
jgi:hypothetical protein